MNTSHYYVDAMIDGDCLDLIVEALDWKDALILWRAHFCVDPDDETEKLRVFRIPPLTGESRPLGWMHPAGLQPVY